MDFDPSHNATVSAFAAWFRQLILLLATGAVIGYAYYLLFAFEGFASAQPFGSTFGAKLSLSGAGSIVWALVWWAIGLALAFAVTSFVASILSLPSLISGFLGFSSFGAATKTFVLGGGGIGNSVWTWIQSAPPVAIEAVKLVDRFFPIAHLIVCAVNVVSMKAFGIFLLKAVATVKRRIPA
jgi:hypothetical protein